MAGVLDTTLDRPGFSQEEDEQEEQDSGELTKVAQEAARRELEFIKRNLKKKATDYAKKKLAKQLATRAVLRTVNIACASSLVFIGVTWLIWTGQYILGNLRKSKIIPHLLWWEKPLWAILSILLFGLALILLTVFIVGAAISNPILGVTLLGAVVWNWITGL